MKLITLSLAAISLSLAITLPVLAETEILFDNLDDLGVEVPERGEGLWHFKFGPFDPEGGAAQKFTAGSSGNVTSVTLGLARLLDPGGKLVVSVREVDASDFPGDIVGVLGEVEINSLQRLNSFSETTPHFDKVTITGLVEGLVPGESYFIALHDEDSIVDETRGWLVSAVQSPSDADFVVVDFGNGGWSRPWTDTVGNFGRQHLYARIEGTPQQAMVAYYDTLDHYHVGGGYTDRSTKLTLNNDVAGARDAQPFVAIGDNVTSVTLGLGRQGKSGVLRFEIWNTTSSGRPSELLGVLGEIDYDSVAEVPSWFNAPNHLEEYTIKGNVTDLTPGETYALVFYLDGQDGTTYQYGYGAVDGPEEYEIHEMWSQDPGQPWVPTSSFFNPNIDYYLRAKISGTVSPEPPSDPFIIAQTEDGNVTQVPDLDKYPIGSTVIVTATPAPGFEFVQWVYGDIEIRENPAEIIVAEGLTLTPRFAPVQPEPIDVEILPAMAIRWDSQLGQTYEVQSSPDLENWTTEAVGVEGTGEVMTHFFIREARERYYRVLESK
ncbi:MAG: hypothetical protein R3F19_24040 [Verrucomicrobiales bacterium]